MGPVVMGRKLVVDKKASTCMQHGLQFTNVHINSGDDPCIWCRNLVSFGPAYLQFTRLNYVQQVSISTRVSNNCIQQDAALLGTVAIITTQCLKKTTLM